MDSVYGLVQSCYSSESFFFIQIYISQLGSIYKALHQFIFLSHLWEYTGQEVQTVTLQHQQQQQTAVTQSNPSEGTQGSPSAKKSSVCTTL